MEKQPGNISPEEIVANQESRTLSDAELIKGGAKYVAGAEGREPRLEITIEQQNKAKKEMVGDLKDKSDTARKENMSEEEIEAEIEQRFSDTAQMIADKIKGNVSGTGTHFIEIGTSRESKSFYRRKKTGYTICLTLKGDKIVVDYNAYFDPDIFNYYSTTFSSIFTPEQIAYTAERFIDTGYGENPEIESFKDKVERGELTSNFGRK